MNASETTIPALEHATARKRPPKDLIFHFDRGVQYACKDFRDNILVQNDSDFLLQFHLRTNIC